MKNKINYALTRMHVNTKGFQTVLVKNSFIDQHSLSRVMEYPELLISKLLWFFLGTIKAHTLSMRAKQKKNDKQK